MSNFSTNINELPSEEQIFRNIKIQNDINTGFIHKSYHEVRATRITSKANTANYRTTDGQSFITDNGLLTFDSRNGKILLTTNNPDSDSIKIENSNLSAGITIITGSSGLSVSSNGEINIGANGNNVIIGGDETIDINIDADESLIITSDDASIITTDDILFKSTAGEIILDTGLSSDGVSSLRADSNGDILINTNTSDSNFQTEIHVDEENASASGRNGLLVVSKNSNVTPEIRISYSNADNTKQVINTMGTYSENSTVAQFRKYTGIHYDNKLVAIEGLDFDETDIGRQVVFQQTGNSTIITGIHNVIFPPDNLYLNSNITVGGTYTGFTQKNYKIEIDGIKDVSTGKTSDTFRWSNNSGITYSNTFIPLSEALNPLEYALEDGITIQFDNTEGNDIGEFASFIVRIGATVFDTKNVSGTTEQDKISNSLSNIEVFITTNPFNAFFGTATNNDVIFKTADQERFRITADGSFGASKNKIDARLHLTSDINAVKQVNDNLVSTGENIIGNQLNPVMTELNIGGYIIAYESQEANTEYYDIYADYFTANGEKVGNGFSFKINKNVLYNQSHPHIAKSGDTASGNYMIVWSSQDLNDINVYQIRGAILKNGNQFVNQVNDLFISSTTTDIALTPRVCGLSNGNYVITYCSLSDDTDDALDNPIYNIKYVITDKTGNIIKAETAITSSTTLNNTYPFICALNSDDSNTTYAGGFVIAYMKEVFSADNRYQIVYKVFTSNGSTSTPEHEITTTGSRGEVGEINTDFNLSDGRCSLMSLPRELALNGGGFLVAYQTNFSASVEFITNPTRTLTGLSSGASGDLISSSINSTTGVHTIIINAVNGDFLQGELLSGISDIQGQSGFFLEKVQNVTSNVVGGIKVSTIILSKDPRQIVVARYSTNGIDNASPNNVVYRKIMNTTILVNDRLLTELNANDTEPINFIRSNSIYYAFRGMPILNNNMSNNGIVCWQTGYEPNVYYQIFNLVDGSFIDNEKLIAENNLGYRQTDPYIGKLLTTQGNILGYSISFSASSLDLSDTGIFQELIGPDSYLFHMNNETVEFVLDNNGRLGIGTLNPQAYLHIKSVPTLNTSYTDQVSMILETSSNNINNNDDLHKISFKNGNGLELARMKVKYSNSYQDMNPDADNLIAYFKLDEEIGSLIAVDSGLYNLLVDTNPNLIASNLGASALLNGFDINNCWKTGLINNGLEFNGLTSYLLIPRDSGDITYINTIDEIYAGSFTISLWLKIDTNIFNGVIMDIISFGDEELSEGPVNGSGYFKCSLIDNNNDGNLRPRFSGLYSIDQSGNLTLTNLQITNSSPLNNNEWHNLIFHHTRTEITTGVYESRIVIYQDGIEIGNSDSTFSSGTYLLGNVSEVATDLDVYIGAGVAGGNNYYRGMMDELRFYRSALTSLQISRIYKYGSTDRTQVQIQTLGNNTTFSDLEPGLVIDDTGAIVSGRFKNNISRQLSGIVKVEVSNKNIVVGISRTKFISEIQIGDNLFLDESPDGADLGSAIAGNFYQVEEIYSDTRLKLNRGVDGIITDTYFSHVTVRPSVLLAYNDDEEIKMNIDFNGDVIIGNGKASTDITKLEIRGDNTNRTQKNGLSLSNTNINTSIFYLDEARGNHILYKAQTDSNTSIIMGSLEICHSNTGVSDDKSVFNIKLNDGSGTNLASMKTIASFTGSGKINFGNNVLENNMLNDIQFNGKIDDGTREDLRIAFLANDNATGVYSESTHLNFFGGQSINTNDNNNDNSALVKILISNDKPIIGIEDVSTAVNGRIDFQVNKQLNSSISGLKTRLCLTSLGYNGVHIIKPDGPFDIAPEFKEDLIGLNPITNTDNSTKIITFTDNNPATAPLFSTSDEAFLRCGRLVVNDGSNLSSYIISSGINGSIFNNSDSELVLNNNESLTSNLIVGKDYTIHYPGLKSNKYGQIGIGDSRFGDNNTCHHLSVSGNTCIKGELHITNNIDVINCSSISSAGFKVNESGELLVKDSTTGGTFVKTFGGPISSSINTYTNDTILTYDNSTVLINNTSNTQINITIPNTSSDFTGRMFNIKKISNVGNVRILCNDGATIDGFDEQFIINKYSGLTIQTDGINWYVISSHLVPDDIAAIIE
jgi:hypothetical protein